MVFQTLIQIFRTHFNSNWKLNLRDLGVLPFGCVRTCFQFLCSLNVLILCSTQFHLEDSTSFHLKKNTLLPILVINQTQIRVATNALCYYKKTLSWIRCSHKYYSKIWLTQLISLYVGGWKVKNNMTMKT